MNTGVSKHRFIVVSAQKQFILVLFIKYYIIYITTVKPCLPIPVLRRLITVLHLEPIQLD